MERRGGAEQQQRHRGGGYQWKLPPFHRHCRRRWSCSRSLALRRVWRQRHLFQPKRRCRGHLECCYGLAGPGGGQWPGNVTVKCWLAVLVWGGELCTCCKFEERQQQANNSIVVDVGHRLTCTLTLLGWAEPPSWWPGRAKFQGSKTTFFTSGS